MRALANKINDFFQSVSADLPPLASENKYMKKDIELPDYLTIPVTEVEDNLARMKLGKAPGPDNIQSWMLRDLAPYISRPVTAIFNASLRDGYVPETWKEAYVTPLPKKRPPKEIAKDIRPISLTSLLAKQLEKCVIKRLRTTTDGLVGENQYGNSKGLSTTHLLVKLLDTWLKALDKPNTAVRVVFLDYTKAFDRINHHKLMDKYSKLGVHPILLRWLAAFLQGRTQRVKIGDGISDAKHIKAAVPQGAILGMEAFIVMIDDLQTESDIDKYVDDTTLSEIINLKAPSDSRLQFSLNHAVQWTKSNDMSINAGKTNAMNICFARTQSFDDLTIEDKPIETVESTKLVGVHIQNDLKWNTHISSIVKKSYTRIHFLSLLKRAKAPEKDMINFYLSIIRPVLEYACPAWSTSLPHYLSEKLESVQKRCMKIIYPGHIYSQALEKAKLTSLYDRRNVLCHSFFKQLEKPDNKLFNLLPPLRKSGAYHLRKAKKYECPRIRTERYKNSFVPFCAMNCKT